MSEQGSLKILMTFSRSGMASKEVSKAVPTWVVFCETRPASLMLPAKYKFHEKVAWFPLGLSRLRSGRCRLDPNDAGPREWNKILNAWLVHVNEHPEVIGR